MKNLFLLTSITGVCLLLSCGGNDRLSDEQKAQFYNTLVSVGRVPKAVSTAKTSGENLSETLADTHGLLSGRSLDGDTHKMAAIIQRAFQKNECGIEINNPKEFKMPSDPNGGFTMPTFNTDVEAHAIVTGAQCPISMNLQVSLKASGGGSGGQSSGNIRVAFVWEYEARTEEFKSAADILSVSLKGEFSLDSNVSQTSMSMKGGGSINGQIVSKKEGTLKFFVKADFDMSGDQSGGSGSAKVALGFEYPTHKAVLSAESKGSSKGAETKYYVGADEVDQKEFSRYASALFGGTAPQQGPKTDSLAYMGSSR